MGLGQMTVKMDKEDALRLERLTEALSRLADEVRTYNATNRDVFYTIVSAPEGKSEQ